MATDVRSVACRATRGRSAEAEAELFDALAAESAEGREYVAILTLNPKLRGSRSRRAIATDVWAVDTAIAVDILRVFAPLAECRHCPDAMGRGKHFEAIVRARGPAAEAGERKETI